MLPTMKYVPSEWNASKALQFSHAEKESASAERLRSECVRLRKETEALIKKAQDEVEHEFTQRLRDIEFWKDELAKRLSDNAEEIQNLHTTKRCIEEVLKDLQFPLEVTQQCLQCREKRIAVENVHDETEIQLIKEMEVIQGVQALLQQLLEQVVEQIRLMKACKYRLEKDLKDKGEAQNIDNSCARLNTTSPGLSYAQDAIRIQTNSITPQQWEAFSNDNILKSEQERNASVALRGLVRSVLDEVQQDVLQQRAAVNLAFEKRIHEVGAAKETLNQHLKKVLEETGSMQENVDALIKAIQTHEGPCQVAETRLKLRAARPSNELVRDPVQYSLVKQVGRLSSSVEQLKLQLEQSETALKALFRTELELRDEIEAKENSLHIDKDECLALRMQLVTPKQTAARY